MTTPTTIWTIGHSTHSLEELVGILTEFRIQAIADVRSFPGSRRFPQYGREALKATLPAIGIGYHWLPALGGRRRALPDSRNVAWRNASFRGYADYMSTPEFAHGLAQLSEMSITARTAIMCSEAVWWRCHRAMIADALCVRGVEVVHILGKTRSVVHPMTAPARIVEGALTYAVIDPRPVMPPGSSG